MNGEDLLLWLLTQPEAAARRHLRALETEVLGDLVEMPDVGGTTH